ncbi:MAG: flagellar basal body P-ring formation protein FlgA [Rhizobiaceae bacterium]|nr:flagellar basal body P-ring formation protein FlgA [Rhizobiaceae bacterium]MCV0407020.1 flagellar basal body P-ring formation protein FlgA [Rhizobiaceae bacterium]
MRLALAHALAIAVLAAPVPAAAENVVAIVNRTIYPGETIPSGALEEVELKRALKSREAVATTISDLEGRVARRTLLPRRLVPLSSVRDAWLVERGKSVRVVFEAGKLSISTNAVPLESGGSGDLIKVRNIDSGAIFTGTVMADGTVRVGAS